MQKGFVVLFTVLIASIVLLMALGISNIAAKEVLLSIQARDAARAFFAADAGMECALYQDKSAGVFIGNTNPNFKCKDVDVTFTSSSPIVNSPITKFIFYINLGQDPSVGCTRVEVTKDTSSPTPTRIESFGYNTHFSGGISTTPDLCKERQNSNGLVERAYRATY